MLGFNNDMSQVTWISSSCDTKLTVFPYFVTIKNILFPSDHFFVKIKFVSAENHCAIKL